MNCLIFVSELGVRQEGSSAQQATDSFHHSVMLKTKPRFFATVAVSCFVEAIVGLDFALQTPVIVASRRSLLCLQLALRLVQHRIGLHTARPGLRGHDSLSSFIRWVDYDCFVVCCVFKIPCFCCMQLCLVCNARNTYFD